MSDAQPVNLKDLTPEELEEFLVSIGEKAFRARQLLKWLYIRDAASFDEMTDLSKDLRARLDEKAKLSRHIMADQVQSGEGVRKFLWELEDGCRIESVLIPEKDHLTLCISSQVGCAMGCRFCRTARMGLKRNLRPSEILDQVLGAQREVGPENRVTNLVFMGMGEPLANRENVVRALRVLIDPALMGLSRRHISLSTVGLVPELPRLAEAAPIGLTVSLNAPDDDVRGRIMPVNQRYSMAELHRALAAFPLPRGRKITIAYVLLKGVNDSLDHARKLARYLRGLKVKINLIPFNTWPGAEFEPPDDADVTAFQEVLIDKNLTTMVRKSKGRDVSAACGQLAGERTKSRVRASSCPIRS